MAVATKNRAVRYDEESACPSWVMSQTNFIMTRVEQVVWPFTTINMLITAFNIKYRFVRNTPFTTDIQYSMCVSIAFYFVFVVCVYSLCFRSFRLFVFRVRPVHALFEISMFLCIFVSEMTCFNDLSTKCLFLSIKHTPVNLRPLTHTR